MLLDSIQLSIFLLNLMMAMEMGEMTEVRFKIVIVEMEIGSWVMTEMEIRSWFMMEKVSPAISTKLIVEVQAMTIT